MTTKLCASLTALAVCLSLACNDKVEPPPQFNTVLTDGDDGSGTKLLPVRLARRDKSTLIAPAASSETPPSAAEGSATAEPKTDGVTIDDSTAQAAADSFEAILKSGNLARLPDILVPEQQEAVKQIIGLVQPVQAAQTEFQKALTEKFPGHAFRMGGMPGGMPADVQVTNIEAGDTEATATLEAEGSPAQPIKFRQIDGKWRVEAPQFGQTPSEADLQLMSGVMTKVADAFKGVAAKINDGSITDVQAIPAELAQATGMPEATFSVVAATEEKATGGEENATPAPDSEGNNATPPSDNNPEQSADTSAQPKERERDAVDDAYSGPGDLRAR